MGNKKIPLVVIFFRLLKTCKATFYISKKDIRLSRKVWRPRRTVLFFFFFHLLRVICKYKDSEGL